MKIKFPPKNAEYSKEDLEGLGIEELLELRNLVAAQLGVQAVKSFKDHAAGVAQTWKALERYDKESGDDAAPAAKTKPKKEPKERKPAKSAGPGVVKRPTRKMFSTISKTGEHDGTQGRAHRWPNYKDGMTIVDVIEGDGTEPWDVYNWQGAGIMTVTEPTDEQYAERRAAWFTKHGREDPDVKKAREKEERAAATAKRKEEAEAKRAKREEEKAAKAKEREEKKAAAAEKKAAADKERADKKAAADKAKADKAAAAKE